MSTISIDHLLLPLDDNHSGVDMRSHKTHQSRYFETKDLRRSAKDTERHREPSINAHSVDKQWENLLSQCADILTCISKDVEIACWYIEAAVRVNGLKGLKQGLLLLNGMVSLYWQELHPSDTVEGEITKINPISSLNGHDRPGSLIEPLSWLAITNASQVDNFSQWQYLQAIISKDNTTLQAIDNAAKATPSEFYLQSYDLIRQCMNEYDKLIRFFDTHAADVSPPSSHIKNGLSELQHSLIMIAKNTIGIDLAGNTETEKEASLIPTTQTTSHDKQHTWTRDSALTTLLDIGDFFATNEPHSPVPYLLKRAVHWGNLSLAELLTAIVKDDNTRNDIFNLTGIDNTTH